MSLTSLALSALNTAQNRLQITGHNISNAATDGYNRQSVFVQSAGAQATSAGYIGRGVQAVTVYRAYDSFINKQLVQSESSLSSAKSYQIEVTQVNNLFADRTTGISPALQKFFEGVNAVASSPNDAAARQEMLGRADSLVTQVRDTQAFLDEQRSNVNTQIGTLVDQANSLVERIESMNKQIVSANASVSSQPPNDLLDQRDQLVRELNQIVGVTTFEQDGVIGLTIGNGETLLGAGRITKLVAVSSADDPSRRVVGLSSLSASGGVRELSESGLKGGSLGGLLQYRSEILDTVQNDLGRMAVGITYAFNAIHQQGANLADVVKNPPVASGSDFFAIELSKAIPVRGTPDSVGVPTIELKDVNQLTSADYKITYNGTKYEIKSSLSSEVVEVDPANGLTATVDGIEFDLSGIDGATVAAGNSWTIQPTRSAASQLSVTIKQPSDIAVATPGTGVSNGDIGLKLAQLQTEKVLGGNSLSFNEAYSQVVNKIGVLTQQNKTTVTAQTSLVNQNFKAQQELSGVDLNEEYINLDRFQEQFRAASRLIDASSKMFDVLMSLRG